MNMSNDNQKPDEGGDTGGLSPEFPLLADKVETMQKPQPRISRSFGSQPQEEEPVQTEPAQQQAAVLEPMVIPYTKPDGTQGEKTFSDDPEERKQQIANYISGTEAYLRGSEVVKEKAPELAGDWRELVKGNQQILQAIVNNQEAAANQNVDPLDLMTPEQKAHYDYVLNEKGDEAEAKLILNKSIADNTMLYEVRKKSQEQDAKAIQNQAKARIAELRHLDKTLPKPTKGNTDAFQREFNAGFGGWLQDMGFTEEQIYLSENIDLEGLYKAYKPEDKQSLKPKDITKANADDAVKAATLSPEVEQSIKNLGAGNVAASIGNNDGRGSEYRNAKTRADVRELAGKNPAFIDDLLDGTGISQFLPNRK
jgi:hypothetical protein